MVYARRGSRVRRWRSEVWRQPRWCSASGATVAVLGHHGGGDIAIIVGGAPIDDKERQQMSHAPI